MNLVSEVVEQIKQQFKFLPDGVGLNQPADIGENQPTVIPDGCRLEGLGFYQTNQLFVAKTTFNALSETDKAAFILHEAIYYIYREYHFWEVTNMNSSLSRQMTALLFSNCCATSGQIEDFFKTSIDWFSKDAKRVLLDKSEASDFKIVVRPKDKLAHFNLQVTCSGYFPGAILQKKELIDAWGDSSLSINRNCKSMEVRVLFTEKSDLNKTPWWDVIELFYNDKLVDDSLTNEFGPVINFFFARK